MEPHSKGEPPSLLSAQDLLAGSGLLHELPIPEAIRLPGSSVSSPREARCVRLRPLSVGTLAIVSRAARDDPALVPLLMVKESMVEPAVTLDHVRQMHVGLVHFLIGEINRISGLGPDGEAYDEALNSPVAQTHVLLARHFGWAPEQVAQLTPAQVMVYLAGIEKLLAFEAAHSRTDS